MQISATLITLLLISYTSVYFVNVQAQCYWPNGKPSPDTPCKPAASASACCGAGWDCLSNGLCSQAPRPYIVRGSCTDQTWSTSECPTYCAFNHTSYGALGPCHKGSTVGDGGDELASYCCDQDYYCKCSTGENVVLLNPSPGTVPSLALPSTSITSSMTSYSSTSTSVSSASTSVPLASTSNPTAKTSLPSATVAPLSNNYTAIGVGLGVPLGLATLGVIAFLLWKIRNMEKKTTMQPDVVTQTQQPVISYMQQPSIAEIQQRSIAGMQQPPRSERHELDHSSGIGQALPELCELEPYAKTSRGRNGAQE